MSAPNKSFDPVEVAVLKPEAVDAAVAEALAAIAAAADLDELKAARLAHAGDRSPLALANREIGALPPQAKAEAGKRVGLARTQVREALERRQVELEDERDARVLVEEAVDVTLPYGRRPAGARHPLTTLQERVEDVFVAMGWEVAEGPEVEAEWLNFDALNLGPDHPARTMQDTFFVGSEDSGVVLRTHTSPVQVRSMLDRELPIYVVCPGKVFRTDELDSTHTPVFHQVEGLVVDEGITVADLKGTLDHFATAMFGPETRDALASVVLPLHRAVARVRHLVHRRQGRSAVDRVGRLRHGQPARARRRRHRPGALLRLRVRHGHRAHPHVPPRRHRHARHGRGRRALHPSVRPGGLMRIPLSWLREYVDLPPSEDAAAIGERLVSIGLELEDIEVVGGDNTGPLVVARVLQIDRAHRVQEAHPLLPRRGRRCARPPRHPGRARHRVRRPQLRRGRPRGGRAARCGAARAGSPSRAARPTGTSPTA